MTKRKRNKLVKAKAKTLQRTTRKVTRSTVKGLPERTAKGRRLAENAMEPYLDEFQRAADEQTRQDFGPGILNKTTHIVKTKE